VNVSDLIIRCSIRSLRYASFYGGFSYSNELCDFASLTATGNSVIVDGIGGYARSPVNHISIENRLNIHSARSTVAGVQNFQHIGFYVPADLATNGGAGGNDAMLYVNKIGTTHITGATVSLTVDPAHDKLQAGDHLVLINVNPGELKEHPVNDKARANAGVTLSYDFDILIPTSNLNQLWAYLPIDPTVNPETEDFSKGYLAGMSLLSQGLDLISWNDLISWHGLNEADRAAREACCCGYEMFFDMSGGWSRFDTGCHVDMSSLSLIAGVAKYRKFNPGFLTLGAFFEYGTGSYDTDTVFDDFGPVRGSGHIRYYGGGVLGRMDFNAVGRWRSYAETSVRVGGLTNGYYNRDIRDNKGVAASYDASAPYYGVHLGGGKIWDITNKSTLDLYAKYLWTGLGGDAVTLSTGDPVDFQCVNSHRTRLGARYSDVSRRTFRPYIGAAWEYEFAGDARATTYGYALDVPTLRGGTGIGELGVSWKPSTYRGCFVDLGIHGYTGIREGLAANLSVGRNF